MKFISLLFINRKKYNEFLNVFAIVFYFSEIRIKKQEGNAKKYIYFVFVEIKQKSSNFIGNMISIDMILNTL